MLLFVYFKHTRVQRQHKCFMIIKSVELSASPEPRQVSQFVNQINNFDKSVAIETKPIKVLQLKQNQKVFSEER